MMGRYGYLATDNRLTVTANNCQIPIRRVSE